MALTPDGTFAKSITTADGTWLIGPQGETALAKHMNNGYGRIYCWSGNTLYVQGLEGNDQWYVWRTGNHWELFGANPPIPMPPSFEPLLRVRARGSFFELVSGERHTVIQSTDFQLFQLYLDGVDIEPTLKNRMEVGFNTLRVLGMCAQMFPLFPQNYGARFYSSIGPFCDLCAKYGLYVEFVVFADATIVMASVASQIDHWNNVGVMAQPITNIRLEVVNEANQPVNRLDSIQQLNPITGVVCSHGSNGSEATPVRPWYKPGYETFHTNDAFEWWRKVGHNAMEFSDGTTGIPASHVPIITNENTRPDRDGNVNHFFDAAAGASLLCGGSCFHCNEGKNSTPFGPSLPFAQAWVAGARSVPLEFQDGTYMRRDDLLTPALLRVYERRLPDGRGHIVPIRK